MTIKQLLILVETALSSCREVVTDQYLEDIHKRQVSLYKKARSQKEPWLRAKNIMLCREAERSRAAGTTQHPVEPDPPLQE